VSSPTQATSERFGYGWVARGRPAPITSPIAYHLHAMQSALGAPAFTGRVLDAGCGEGIDLASVSFGGSVTGAVGVELSHGGIAATSARIEGLPKASLIQGNVLSLPFAGGVFDGAYSYGVVHHTIDPEGAVREIARVLKPGAALLVYVYEDFSGRPILWRVALRAVNAFRGFVSSMSPANIRRFCAVIAPLVYATCTWPSKHFRFARRFPYPASQNPTLASLVPDLYDRFAAPIEQRYSEQGARRLAEQAGCRVRRSAFLRGWAVWAEKI
jgi:SAM-dependent methyltransferase